MFIDKLKEVVEFARKKEIYPDIYKIKGPSTNPEVEVFVGDKTEKKLMFSSNNYLGIANDERVKRAVMRGIEKYGMGSGGSRLVSGNIEIQEELERQIAQFKGCEAAITFSTGYMANTGGIPAILNPPSLSFVDILNEKIFKKNIPVVFSDELNHASIVDACRMSKSKRVIYYNGLGKLDNPLRYNWWYNNHLCAEHSLPTKRLKLPSLALKAINPFPR